MHLDEAEKILGEVFVESRLESQDGSRSVRMDLLVLQLGSLTVTRLGFGAALRHRTAEAVAFHLDTPLGGPTVYRYGDEPEIVSSGGALAFSPGRAAVIDWSPSSLQQCLVIAPGRLEVALEQAWGRPVREPLLFDRRAPVEPHVSRQWRRLVAMLDEELDMPTGLATNPTANEHLEALVLDSLILDYRHNYTDDPQATKSRGRSRAVARALELIEDDPAHAWSVIELAAAVHLSPRALQEAFSRDLQMPPMTYLRRVRLRRVHAALVQANPETSSVQALAHEFGFLHLGRFAATYREAFGLTPSEALRGGWAPRG